MTTTEDRAPSAPLAGRALKFLLRHWPLWLLLTVMAVFATGTAGIYLWSDDLKWVLRTAADAPHPLNAFIGSPLFGNYYRPVPHLVWLMNYYLWGLGFGGHQFMFILMWLLGPALVYAVGYRLGGRLAGIIAATIIGLNDIYLMMSSWKSWYTSLTEFCAVLAWAAFYIRWLETRRKGPLAGWIAMGVVAVLSRELAPLIISAGIFVSAVLPLFRAGPKSRAWEFTLLWAASTLLVLLVHPAYRAQIALLSGPAATPGAASGGMGAAFVWERFKSHTISMFQYGLSPYLLTAAVLLGIARAARKSLSKPAMLGMIVIGLVLVGILNYSRPMLPSMVFLFACMPLLLIVLFLISAALGDRNDRLLAAWFVMSFAPILVLELKTNAYHLLALTAITLYVGRSAALFLAEYGGVVRQHARGVRDRDARYALVLVLAVCLVAQGVMLVMGLRRAGPLVARRAANGRATKQIVEEAVSTAVRACPERAIWADVEDREAMLAGLLLQERHGFTVRVLTGPDNIGLRKFNSRLRMYTAAVRHDDDLFRSLSLVADPGFENAPDTVPTADAARTGRKSLSSSVVSVQMRDLYVSTPKFDLPAGAYVFGGFLRRDAKKAFDVHAVLYQQGEKTRPFKTPNIPRDGSDWCLVWECADIAEGGLWSFLPIVASQAQHGRVLADDVFLCRVEDLERKGKAPEGAKTLSEYWLSGQ
jgi:hypothetical protein